MKYARLNHDFDRPGLLEAIRSIPTTGFVEIAPTKFEKSNFPYAYTPPRLFSICTDDEYENLTYSYWEGRTRHTHHGRFATFRHCILTHVPDRPDLLYADNVMDGNGKYCRPYIHHDDQAWTWRTDIPLDLIRAEIDRLPFEYVLRVRIIHLPHGERIGNVHTDSVRYFSDPWYARGNGIINLNILSGGSTLRIDVGDRIIDVNDDVFTFDECLPHGVTRATGERFQINVVGRRDVERFAALVDQDNQIR